jgi:outer membrane protein assembly factor BamB
MRATGMMFVYVLLGVAMVSGHAAESGVIGWRGDGSGNFANANPPLSFSTNENLTWKADIGQGCGAAIVVGSRLFVQAAPNALVCLDKATGKELWRRTHHAGALDTNRPSCRLDAAMDLVGKAHELKQKAHRLPKESDEREQCENEFKETLAALPPGLPGLPGAGISTSGRSDGGGYSSLGRYLICVTPCSDGRRVVAVFPTGIAVAYDLEGRFLWNADLGEPPICPANLRPGQKWRPSAGFIANCPVMTPEGIVLLSYGPLAQGVSAGDGKAIWSKILSNRSYASPVHGAVDGVSFVVTDGGDILRVRDGLTIYDGKDTGPSGECSVSPVFADGVFHWVTHAVKVVPGDPPRAETVWEMPLEQLHKLGRTPVLYRTPRLSGCDDFCSPVLANGRVIYHGFNGLWALDAASGRLLTQCVGIRPSVKALSSGAGKAWPYGGMIRAGDHLILIHDNGLVKMFPINDTFTPPKFAAIPDDVYAQPTCDGRALYIRSLNALWRFDRPADDGAAGDRGATTNRTTTATP